MSPIFATSVGLALHGFRNVLNPNTGKEEEFTSEEKPLERGNQVEETIQDKEKVPEKGKKKEKKIKEEKESIFTKIWEFIKKVFENF
jgi:cell division ATPase FtsA